MTVGELTFLDGAEDESRGVFESGKAFYCESRKFDEENVLELTVKGMWHVRG